MAKRPVFALANHINGPSIRQTSSFGQTQTRPAAMPEATRPKKSTHEVLYSRKSTPKFLYAHAKIDPFIQEQPHLHNPFIDDPLLARVLKRWMPLEVFKSVSEDLHRFGDRVVAEVEALGRDADIEHPRLEQFDAWGNRVDRLVVCPAWRRLKQIGAEEGLIAIGYEGKYGSAWDRVHQFAKLFLFAPSAALVTCPIAAGDGAAKAIKELGWSKSPGEVGDAFRNLTSRNPATAWTSGQWMTEKRGGSDVANACDTYARDSGDNKTYYLNGYKWFSSATDSEMSLALARVVDEQGNAKQGSQGLSLFYVPMCKANGSRNGIQIVKLKNKLGTRQLPTGELLLDGASAVKLSEDGRGVAAIANMLNLTRIHNATCAVAGMRRVISLARDYATRRSAFGSTLEKKPLHVLTLARMETETRACQMLLFESARLLGLQVNRTNPIDLSSMQESGDADETQLQLLRLATPLLKLYTGKQCVPLISEGLECFGGQGFIEDTGLPCLLRDAQIYPIWEGTTNVVSLDVLRVFAHSPSVWQIFESTIAAKLSGNIPHGLEASHEAIRAGMKTVSAAFLAAGQIGTPKWIANVERGARDLSMAIARLYAGSLLLEQAAAEQEETDIDAAQRYCMQNELVDLRTHSADKNAAGNDFKLVYKNFGASKL